MKCQKRVCYIHYSFNPLPEQISHVYREWQQASNPACYFMDSCCETAFVELVAHPVWHKDRMLAATEGVEAIWAPKTWNQQFPDSLMKSTIRGIYSLHPLITHPLGEVEGGVDASAKGRKEKEHLRVFFFWSACPKSCRGPTVLHHWDHWDQSFSVI